MSWVPQQRPVISQMLVGEWWRGGGLVVEAGGGGGGGKNLAR